MTGLGIRSYVLEVLEKGGTLNDVRSDMGGFTKKQIDNAIGCLRREGKLDKYPGTETGQAPRKKKPSIKMIEQEIVEQGKENEKFILIVGKGYDNLNKLLNGILA